MSASNRKRILRSAVAIALGMLRASFANAQQPLQALALQAHDVAAVELTIEPSWVGGILRVRVDRSAKKLPAQWTLVLETPGDAPRKIDSAALGALVVERDGDDSVTLDLPVTRAKGIRARVSPSDLRVRTIGVFAVSTAKPEQIVSDNARIDFFDDGVSANERKWGPSFARLDLLGAQGELWGFCTGFKVAKRLWMTAAHCIAADPEGARGRVSQIRVQPFDYRDQAVGHVPQWARPVASGQRNGVPNTTLPLATDDLDYAVLEIEGDLGNAPPFDLRAPQPAAIGDSLQLFQHWTGRLPPTPGGKARAADDTCTVIGDGPKDASATLDRCPYQLRHGCSSEPGASGGPLLERTSLKMVAVHVGAGLTKKFNCALRIEDVRRDLCARNPTLAKEITTCD